MKNLKVWIGFAVVAYFISYFLNNSSLNKDIEQKRNRVRLAQESELKRRVIKLDKDAPSILRVLKRLKSQEIHRSFRNKDLAVVDDGSEVVLLCGKRKEKLLKWGDSARYKIEKFERKVKSSFATGNDYFGLYAEDVLQNGCRIDRFTRGTETKLRSYIKIKECESNNKSTDCLKQIALKKEAKIYIWEICYTDRSGSCEDLYRKISDILEDDNFHNKPLFKEMFALIEGLVILAGSRNYDEKRKLYLNALSWPSSRVLSLVFKFFMSNSRSHPTSLEEELTQLKPRTLKNVEEFLGNNPGAMKWVSTLNRYKLPTSIRALLKKQFEKERAQK